MLSMSCYGPMDHCFEGCGEDVAFNNMISSYIGLLKYYEQKIMPCFVRWREKVNFVKKKVKHSLLVLCQLPIYPCSGKDMFVTQNEDTKNSRL